MPRPISASRAKPNRHPLPPGDFPMAILAKAPLPGQAKTRLIPALGAQGAADLHARLVRRTVATALEATRAENITLWTALDHVHPLFIELAGRYGIRLAPQPEGSLGDRMHHALSCMRRPGLLIGTDCPVLSRNLLITCHNRLCQVEGVFLPAEDGGYALVGVRRTAARLFSGIHWGSSRVMAQTRARVAELGWTIDCPTMVWDLDRAEDLRRLADMDALSQENTL
ncbi:TIGR04282 family arsenosugar biosynthesis glycosyltransferase [Halomonas sp. V046]|uniref:TIGR04282 family arsenosugar biosynthesis glycosyltransferase n=1 Tax=Halomonas sp. V046 TaxID=3459611 RepID=UPI0040442908